MEAAGQLELLEPLLSQAQAVESILVHVAVGQVVELYVELGVLGVYGGGGLVQLADVHVVGVGEEGRLGGHDLGLLVLVQADHHPAR